MTQPQARMSGVGVVITRPLAHAFPVSVALRAIGATPFVFPAIEIVESERPEEAYRLIERLEAFHLAIFVSQNAVERGLAMVNSKRRFPPRLLVAGVGSATASALESAGFEDVIQPAQGGDSEALLALPSLQQIRDKRVVIFRGQGGRETLLQVLTERGAHVSYIECYRRQRPRADPRPLLEEWGRGAIQAVNVMSGETLNNFANMIGHGGAEKMRETPLFVPHANVAQAARAFGCAEVHVTASGNEGLIRALEARFAHARVGP
jgi:uroporphyrinogen-III synthase